MKRSWMAFATAILSVAMVGLYAVGSAPDAAFAATLPDPFAGGNGSVTSPYQIDTVGQLAYLSQYVNCGAAPYASAHYNLCANLDLGGTANWVPIGTPTNPFCGTFDGLWHGISGLNVKVSGNDAGLFGDAADSTLENLDLIDPQVSAGSHVGALAGLAGRVSCVTASNVSVRGDGSCIGGLVGTVATNGSIEESFVTSGTVSDSVSSGAAGCVGGLAGAAISCVTLEHDESGANVTVAAPSCAYDVGGMAGGARSGQGDGLCQLQATGSVMVEDGGKYSSGVGGLFGGETGAGKGLTLASSTGAVTVSNATYGCIYDVGGLTGFSTGNLNATYASGDVSAIGNGRVFGLGGLDGYATCISCNSDCSRLPYDVTDSYATGPVRVGGGSQAVGDIGGLLGKVSCGTVADSYAIGTVPEQVYDEIGGLIGYNKGSSVVDSYFLSSSQVPTESAGQFGAPRTAQQLSEETTYSGWDFNTVWALPPSVPAPVLQGVPIDPAFPELSGATSVSAVDGAPLQTTLAAVYGAAPYKWSLLAGTLPLGLDLNQGGTGSAAQIAGTPTSLGTYPVEIGITDANGFVTPVPVTIDVGLAVPAGLGHTAFADSGWTETWSPVVGASEYDVYVATVNGSATSTPVLVGTVPATAGGVQSFGVSGEQSNTAYAVTVVAVGANGEESASSAPDFVDAVTPSVCVTSTSDTVQSGSQVLVEGKVPALCVGATVTLSSANAGMWGAGPSSQPLEPCITVPVTANGSYSAYWTAPTVTAPVSVVITAQVQQTLASGETGQVSQSQSVIVLPVPATGNTGSSSGSGSGSTGSGSSSTGSGSGSLPPVVIIEPAPSNATSPQPAVQFTHTFATQVIGSSGGTLDGTVGGSHVSLSVGPGAFSGAETVSLTTAGTDTEGMIAASLSPGDEGLTYIGVTFSGNAPSLPVTLTIDNPSIMPGDVFYKVTPDGGLIALKATITPGQAILSFTNDPDFVLASRAAVQAFPSLPKGEREIVIGSSRVVVPALVGRYNGVETTYMPIWYVMQVLRSAGVTSSWNGVDWRLGTLAGGNYSDRAPGQGAMALFLNGRLIFNVNGEVALDPWSNRMTTYMPIWFVMQTLMRAGITSTWNGTTWVLTEPAS